MHTIVDSRPSAESPRERFDLATLISELSSRFINLPAAQVDFEIEDTLRAICEPLGFDLAVLWQWSQGDPDVVEPTHVHWALPGPRPLGSMAQEHYPWTCLQMLQGRPVLVASMDTLPEEAAVDRETCRRIGIKSALALPLAVGGGRPIGVLGLNTLRGERDWSAATVRQLQLVAQVFANALARQRQEQELTRSEARLAAGVELAGLAFYEVDFESDSIHIDRNFRALCGVPADLGSDLQVLQFWMDRIHPEDRERVLDLRRQLHDGLLERACVEYRFAHPEHGERWLQHVARVARRDAHRRTLMSFGVLRDVTPSKRSEQALRDLSQRLILAHEDERALLARELHDEVTQRLAVLAIDVGQAELAAPQGALADVMRSIRTELVLLSEDVHSLAYQLHPSVLEELGLIEALRAECERRCRQGRISVSTDLAGTPAAMSKDAQLCLFRVAQEALNNVVRHAGIDAASITLRESDGGVLLAVRDEGVGFDPENPRAGRSLGLASMRERMRLVNGTLELESAPGRGTTVVAWAPASNDGATSP
jgi:signal transduction histidine kinase